MSFGTEARSRCNGAVEPRSKQEQVGEAKPPQKLASSAKGRATRNGGAEEFVMRFCRKLCA
jgi:hypothetical protein